MAQTGQGLTTQYPLTAPHRKATDMRTVEWTAEQVCGECGEGVFTLVGELALCTVCEHEHTLDRVNLADNELFVWQHTAHRRDVTLHVVSYTEEEN